MDEMKPYQDAQRLLKDRREGYVPFDMILTSNEQISSMFPKIVSGEILTWIGNRFYWKKIPNQPLSFYAVNDWDDALKDLGPTEICRLRVPECWNGVGRSRIDWPERRKKDEGLLLITLYLYSPDSNNFYRLMKSQTAAAAFMASIFFEHENAELFNDLAEERFESLR